ncbi:hypothetical protein K525DRAFT_269411 [Schizophyllum commune Loenen D]|nr:hypothetical protein K525DRAFT_269411 [Schizophyllum commune Loenen D]
MAALAMPDAPEATEPIPNTYDWSKDDEESIEKKRRNRFKQRRPNPYDYEQKYAEDDYGEELGNNARFWHVLLDEGRIYDAELVDGWRETLDVLLVFTGLFSAVVTAFVVQSSQALKPDYAQISVSLLAEMMALQRAWASGSSIDDVPRSSLALDAVTASALDYWCNGLWYTSLALSMSAALMAVLIKQWLLAYRSNVSGTPKHQALARQFRLVGVERWNVPLIVGLLPMLLHIALLLFFVGLALYVFTFDSAIACVVVALAVAVYALYVVANVLPMLDSQCPYKTPLSQFGYIGLRYLLDKVLRRAALGDLPDPSTSSPRARLWVGFLMTHLTRMFALSTARTPRDRESFAIARNENLLQIECLLWVHATSSNPSAISIAVQAISGLPPDILLHHRLRRDDLYSEIFTRLNALMQAANEENATLRERLARSLLFLEVPQDPDLVPLRTAMMLTGVNYDEDAAELQAAFLALAAAVDAYPQNTLLQRFIGRPLLGALIDSISLPFIHVSSPKALRVQPAVWHCVLPCLRSVEMARSGAVHLGIYLWRHIGPARSANTIEMRSWPDIHYENLSDAPENDLYMEFIWTIHHLVCEMRCAEHANIVSLEDLLLHTLQGALKSLARAAIEVEATAQLSADRRTYHAKLHYRELAKVSFWSVDSRVQLLDVFPLSPPEWAARPLLQAFAHLLNQPERPHIYPAYPVLEGIFPNIDEIFQSYPHEALNGTVEHDILAALWPHVDRYFEIEEGGARGFSLRSYWLDKFGSLLSSYFGSIVQLAYVDRMLHVDYLVRIADVTGQGTTPSQMNHLTWCILLDIVQPRPPWASVAESLHSNILRFARQTSESHSQVWWNILEPMHKVWGNVKPAVGSALRTTCGQQAYLDLVEVIRPGLVAEAMAQPNLDGTNTGDADEGDADRGDREGMGYEAKEDVAEAEN